jgi:hypothetical protein
VGLPGPQSCSRDTYALRGQGGAGREGWSRWARPKRPVQVLLPEPLLPPSPRGATRVHGLSDRLEGGSFQEKGPQVRGRDRDSAGGADGTEGLLGKTADLRDR